MERVAIPGLSQQATRIALGTWSIGGWMWGGTEEHDALRTIAAALDRGINIIDTAAAYGWGRSEELIGRVLAERGGRDRVIIATKFGIEMRDGQLTRNSSPKRIRKETEDSLRRLGTDYVDIYQVHWPDPAEPFEETARLLDGLRSEGKIRAIGVSNFSTEQMDAFRAGAPLNTVQPRFNLLEREAAEDVLPYARRHRLATLVYSPLARGLLSGRMTTDTRFQGDDNRLNNPKFQPPLFAHYLEAVAKLDGLAQERYGRRVVHLAVRWVLDQPGVSVALWGARRPDHLETVDGAMGWKLDAEALAEIDRILDETLPKPAPTLIGTTPVVRAAAG